MSTPLVFPLPLASFRTLFPEFKTAPDTLVQSRLDQAELSIDSAVWRGRSGEGQAYLAADLLVTSSAGHMSRQSPDKQQSTYRVRYDELLTIVSGFSFRVI